MTISDYLGEIVVTMQTNVYIFNQVVDEFHLNL